MNYDNVTMTIDGTPIEFKDFAFSLGRQHGMSLTAAKAFSGGSYSFEVTAEFRAGWNRLMAIFAPPVRGTTDTRLAERVYYGGRKGRSAFRRLLAKGYLGTAVVCGQPTPLTREMVYGTTPQQGKAP